MAPRLEVGTVEFELEELVTLDLICCEGKPLEDCRYPPILEVVLDVPRPKCSGGLLLLLLG